MYGYHIQVLVSIGLYFFAILYYCETARYHIKFRPYFRINPGQEKSHAENPKWGTMSNSTQTHCHLQQKHKALVTKCASFQDTLITTVKCSHLQNSTQLLNNKHQPNTYGPHNHHYHLHQNLRQSWRWLTGEPSFVKVFQKNSCHWVEASWQGAMTKQQNSYFCSVLRKNNWQNVSKECYKI